jgi:hypothetical protein
MLIDALLAALENRPYVFNRVCVDVATDVLILGMNNGVMFGKLFASLGIDAAFIGVQD